MTLLLRRKVFENYENTPDRDWAQSLGRLCANFWAEKSVLASQKLFPVQLSPSKCPLSKV